MISPSFDVAEPPLNSSRSFQPGDGVNISPPPNIAALVEAVVNAFSRHEDQTKQDRPSFSAAPSVGVLTPQHSGGRGGSEIEAASSDSPVNQGERMMLPEAVKRILSPVSPQGKSEGGTSETSAQGEVPARKESLEGEKSEPATESFSYVDPLVELAKAATELYLVMGGKDYFKIAKSTLETLEQTIDLIREGGALLKSLNLIPAAEVSKHAERLQSLLGETKDMMGRTPLSPLSTAADRDRRDTSSTTPFGSPGPHRGSTSTKEPSSSSVLNPAILSRSVDGLAFGPTSVSPLQTGLSSYNTTPTANVAPRFSVAVHDDDMYDVTLMVKTNVRGPELVANTVDDDELLALKAKVKSMANERQQLLATITQLEAQLKRQVETTAKEANILFQQNLEVEKELRWVGEQIDRGVWLPSYGGATAGSKAATPTASNGGSPSGRIATLRKMHRDRLSVDEDSRPGTAGVRSTKTDGLEVETPLERSGRSNPTTPQHQYGHDQDSKTEEQIRQLHAPHPPSGPPPGRGSGYSDAPLIDPNDVPSVRVNKIDALYADTYKGRGMEMLWNTIECIFKREYAVTVSSAGPSPAKGERQTTSPNPLGNSVSSIDPSSPNAGQEAAYDCFRRAYKKRVGDILESRTAFFGRVVETTPLRSDYVANCLSAKLKPNSGVVKLLTRLESDDGVEILSLGANYIGDHGLSAVIPILSRLYRLKELDLSDNGLKNTAIHHLCNALRRHPSIQKLNLPQNPISRAGGKDLLTLASSCPNVREIVLEGTQIEPILKERIEHRCELNRSAVDSKGQGAAAC